MDDFYKVIAHQKQAMEFILDSLAKTIDPVVDVKIEQKKLEERDEAKKNVSVANIKNRYPNEIFRG